VNVPPTLTIPELADQLRVSVAFLRRRVVSGEWPCHRFGALYRFTEDDVAAIVELTARPAEPRSAPAAGPRLVTSSERLERARAVKASQQHGRRRVATG
jgi:excisionase family DNA binding protein